MTKLTDWETKCYCGKHDSKIGNNVWCFYHKGPHPLDKRDGLLQAWRRLRSK